MKRVLGLLVGLLLVGLALDWAFPPNLTRYHQQGSILLADDGTVLAARPAADYHLRFATQTQEVDAQYLTLLKTVEDKWFDRHPGVNPLAILRASYQALRHGEVVSGASTLTMQTVRLLEPRPRNIQSKLIEMVRAFQLEAHYSKSEILSIYLTLAPYGGNVEGVRAASLVWFGKPLQKLSLAEAALLVALPQSPERLRPDRHPKAAQLARAKVLQLAVKANLVSETAAREANEAALPKARHPLPQNALHFAERFRRDMQKSDRSIIHSTLDPALQKSFERLIERGSKAHEKEVSIAGLIVENETGKVRAYVGSANYFDMNQRGMIDMVTAIRSPGSTLKPFIYAMAFDRLLVHPQTIIADIPLRFGSYVPSNFDGGYQGELSVSHALQLSLNLPAVALLDRIGPVIFDEQLKKAGITLRFDRRIGKPTLPIALGGVGLTLENLVQLYTAFTHEGQVIPLQYLQDEAEKPPLPLINPSAAWYVSRILQDAPRPAGFSQPGTASERTALGFKTGTSYGFRDAWAIGFTPRYTLGIWVGRADGAPCSNCLGLKAAAPILMQAIDLLPIAPTALNFKHPDAALNVKSASQLPPGLQRFSLKGQTYAPRLANLLVPPLRLTFPVEGSVIELSADALHIPLKAEGGQRPLTWMVNGIPLPEGDPLSREAVWSAAEAGFVRVTVQDAVGNQASAQAFIQKGEAH